MQVGWVTLEIGLLIVGAVLVLAAVMPGTSELFGSDRPGATRRLVRAGIGGLGLVLIIGAVTIRVTLSKTAQPAPTKQAPDLMQLATVALYSCHAPSDPPAPPDGAKASKDQMIASKRVTSQYNDDMNRYLDCLKTTSANLQAQYRGAAAAGEFSEVDALAVRLNNEAVDRLKLKVNAFNAELAKYKTRSVP